MPKMLARGAFLSVPGSRPDLFDKAVRSGASGVILDLEDAVAPDAKADARRAVVAWIERANSPDLAIVVRVNPNGSEWFHDDVVAVAGAAGPNRSVMLPKVESVTEIARADELIANAEASSGRAVTSILALVESAAGIQSVDALAGAMGSRLVGLCIGFADLAASLNRPARPDTTVWRAVRDRVLVAARAAGIAAIDGPHLETAVDDPFTRDVAEAVMLGFDAKWVIHPAQVAHVSAAFAPTEEAVQQARRILDALEDALSRGAGVVTVDGLMVDEAVAISARRLLDGVGERAGGRD